MAEIINQQALGRELSLKRPIGSIEDALKMNYEKGIIAGMRLAIALPSTMEELEREAFNERLQEERLDGNV